MAKAESGFSPHILTHLPDAMKKASNGARKHPARLALLTTTAFGVAGCVLYSSIVTSPENTTPNNVTITDISKSPEGSAKIQIETISPVEEATNTLQMLGQAVTDIHRTRPNWIPILPLGTILSQVNIDSEKFAQIKSDFGENSPEAEAFALDRIAYYNTAPGKDKDAQPTEITVEPEAKNGELLATATKDFLDQFSDTGFISKVKIVPRDNFPKTNLNFLITGFDDRGVEIIVPDEQYESSIPDSPLWSRPYVTENSNSSEWTRRDYIRQFAVKVALVARPDTDYHNLSFYTPKSAIEWVANNAKIWDTIYKSPRPIMLRPSGSDIGLEMMEDALFASDMMVGSEDYYKNLVSKTPAEDEITQARRNNTIALFSNFTSTELSEMGKNLMLK